MPETLAYTLHHCAAPCERDDAPVAVGRGRSDLLANTFPDLSKDGLAMRSAQHASGVETRSFFRASIMEAGSEALRLRRAAEAAERRNAGEGGARKMLFDTSAMHAAGVSATPPWWLAACNEGES